MAYFRPLNLYSPCSGRSDQAHWVPTMGATKQWQLPSQTQKSVEETCEHPAPEIEPDPKPMVSKPPATKGRGGGQMIGDVGDYINLVAIVKKKVLVNLLLSHPLTNIPSENARGCSIAVH